MPLFLSFWKGCRMNSIKKKSIDSLIDGLSKYEDSKNAVKNADFTDLKQFLKSFLNTSEPKQRRKFAEEFKKRHTELYNFIQENKDLISAEAEIQRTVNSVLSGGEQAENEKQASNLIEMIGESLNGLQ